MKRTFFGHLYSVLFIFAMYYTLVEIEIVPQIKITQNLKNTTKISKSYLKGSLFQLCIIYHKIAIDSEDARISAGHTDHR